MTPGYFAVMGLPILAGRDFADLRDAAAPPQVVVNEAFVRRYLDGADPLGRRVETRGRKYAIAGVVRTSLYNAFGEPPTPMLYFSLPRSAVGDRRDAPAHARRASRPPSPTDLRQVVRDLDPELPVYDVRTLSDHIEANLIFRRIPARMFVVLGAAAAAARGDRHLRGRRVRGHAADDRRSACGWRSARRRAG